MAIPLWLSPDLPAAAADRFVRRQPLERDRPPRVEAAGSDPDFGAEAEFPAIGELGRGVVEHDGAIDPGDELFRDGCVVRDDSVGMARAVPFNVRECGI